MKTTTARNGQTWADLAIEHYGRLEAVVALAAANGAAVNELPESGQTVVLPDVEQDAAIVAELQRRGAHPGTAHDESGLRAGIFTHEFTPEYT